MRSHIVSQTPSVDMQELEAAITEPEISQPERHRKKNVPSILLVVATYNERENLPRLVDQVQSELPSVDILVVDDNSPDGTGQWCRLRQQNDEKLLTIHRSGKLGLGSAAVEGFRFGVENQYDLIATMDADFSHDPGNLKKLIELAKENQQCGLVIGSRYVRGGRIEGWPISRRLASRVVNGLVRLFLRLPTRDNSGAFRVYRRSTLETIGIDTIQTDGYAYLEEVVWKIHRSGITVIESPITFRDRTRGASKASLSVGIQLFAHLFKIAIGRVN